MEGLENIRRLNKNLYIRNYYEKNKAIIKEQRLRISSPESSRLSDKFITSILKKTHKVEDITQQMIAQKRATILALRSKSISVIKEGEYGNIWKEISVAPGYFISELGFAKSKKLVLKTVIDNCGYERLSISKFGIFKMHAIVATAFLENPNNYKCVNHINGIKTDNRVENLEWCNHSQNRNHAIKIRLVKVGAERSGSKLSQKQVDEIRLKYKAGDIAQRELAAQYGVGKSAIYLLLANKTYKNYSN